MSEPTTTTIDSLLRKMTPGRETALEVLEAFDGEGQRLEFTLKDAPPEEPVVAAAQARAHTFRSLDAFCEYLIREAKPEKATILADPDRLQMSALLDEGSEHDREKITFEAKIHPSFARWAALIGKATPVLEFALFVMQNRSSVHEPDGRDLALTFSQIKASKKVTKRSGVGNGSLNGVMIETQIGAERNSVEINLPERIELLVPLLLDRPASVLCLDVLVTEDQNDNLVVMLAAPELERDRLEAFEMMVAHIKSETGMLTGLGTIAERPWKVVEAD